MGLHEGGSSSTHDFEGINELYNHIDYTVKIDFTGKVIWIKTYNDELNYDYFWFQNLKTKLQN